MKNIGIKFFLLLSAVLWTADFSFGADVPIQKVRYAGPFVVQAPYRLDSVDVCQHPYDTLSILETPVNLHQVFRGRFLSSPLLPKTDAACALHLLGFQIQSDGFAHATLHVGGLTHYQLYVDGQLNKDGKLTLEPKTHDIVIKYLSTKGQLDTLQLQLDSPQSELLHIDPTHQVFTLSHLTDRKFVTGVELSATGEYLITAYRDVVKGGKTTYTWKVTNLKSGAVVASTHHAIHWMPRSMQYYWTREGNQGRELVVTDVNGGQENVLATNLPTGNFVMSPTEDYLILLKQNKGPKEDKAIYEILEPEDRQPGWRDRVSLLKYDFATGLCQPLTFGYRNVSLLDISDDGTHLLFMTNHTRLTQRPTTLYNIYSMDLRTLSVEQLVKDDGFVADAAYAPSGKKIVVMASPEAFHGIGANVPQGKIPSMYDYQLYLLNVANRKVTPLTKDFKPGVSKFRWNKYDGQLYFTAMDRDYVHLFRCDMRTHKIQKMAQPEEVVKQIAFASQAPTMVFSGESASNADRVYTINLRRSQTKLVEDTNQETLANVQLGACKTWSFVNSRGDTICGRYYLPPNFDATQQYPLIVNYYGGCSPTSRNFETRYPQHAYAALGYVVYVLQPSGAVGFGQEFSSRHVNTAGKGVAEDIIEGTKKFVAEHAFINAKKIGCIGASYGGFMTQYLQTQTDIFAAAISHAGISDHTSYWGEGYWGYSYSEVSMANSYPWSNPELYVNQSPLFHADKIHTPLLFLHGSADTNVPIGESIQMFTALKLLGRPTAFVVVDGENHHILDYHKRQKWQNTIFAWFAKWLKNDSTWWDALYPKKAL